MATEDEREPSRHRGIRKPPRTPTTVPLHHRTAFTESDEKSNQTPKRKQQNEGSKLNLEKRDKTSKDYISLAHTSGQIDDPKVVTTPRKRSKTTDKSRINRDQSPANIRTPSTNRNKKCCNCTKHSTCRTVRCSCYRLMHPCRNCACLKNCDNLAETPPQYLKNNIDDETPKSF